MNYPDTYTNCFTNGWEEEFDEQFPILSAQKAEVDDGYVQYMNVDLKDEVRKFIKAVYTYAYNKGMEKTK